MVTLALFVMIAPLLLVTGFFSLEVLLGLFPTKFHGSPVMAPDTVIVVPAHNEAAVIAGTLLRLKESLSRNMRILVIADNCSDETAKCARLTGADVVERTAPDRRGKGHALAFAVEQLTSCPPDVLLILDADCSIDSESLRKLAAAAAESGRPCQSVYIFRTDQTAAPVVQISAFAFMLKNLIRQQGLQRLCGECHLTGSGMAFPFQLVSTSLFATSDIVEDLALGLELTMQGHPPKLVPQATVVSSSAAPSDTLIQRARWEGGYLATSIRHVPRLLLKSVQRREPRLLVRALDLMIPPIALLAIINLSALPLLALAGVVGVSWAPFAAHSSFGALAGFVVALTWLIWGRDIIPLAVLARIPVYIAWKLPLYLSFARHGAPRDWRRTPR